MVGTNDHTPDDAELHRHDWFRPSFLSYDCCRICGTVRRADDKNAPCKGPVKVTLRDR